MERDFTVKYYIIFIIIHFSKCPLTATMYICVLCDFVQEGGEAEHDDEQVTETRTPNRTRHL